MRLSHHLRRPPQPDGEEARPRIGAKALGIAGGVSAAGAAALLIVATQVAVQATGDAAPQYTSPIAAESTDEDAPERVAEVAAPTAVIGAYDQLGGDEIAWVRHVVSGSEDYAAGAALGGAEGLQYLSTDVADPNFFDDGVRRLQLLYYDYAADELVSFLVRSNDGTIERTERTAGVQPAPSNAEAEAAWQLLLDDPEAGAAIAADFRGATGEQLDPSRITVAAHSFSNDGASFGAESCGVERCLQVHAQIDGGAYLVTSPWVISLSSSAVLPIS